MTASSSHSEDAAAAADSDVIVTSSVDSGVTEYQTPGERTDSSAKTALKPHWPLRHRPFGCHFLSSPTFGGIRYDSGDSSGRPLNSCRPVRR